ncbi:MAG: Sapep family Mn(2+)-dependent dipeptidase [Ruminococcus sp.]|nr:Sapep family Mn(2+)-dependent dipeptidase [Ruminococcus sp.]
MFFGSKILDYKEEILNDLNTLLSFESVADQKPEECAKALDFIMKRAKEFGLSGEIVTDKSAHVQLGEGGKLCGVLAHLDVVPAGGNWTVEPFALTDKDGRLFGRGIADDKGAALLNLYCLRAIKESGVEGKNTVRAIYGTTEECGMEDMNGYFEKMPIPDMSFTPDSDYGVCFAEKGILQLKVTAKSNDAKFLNQFNAGKAVNAVPEIAYALIDTSQYDEDFLEKLAEKKDGKFEFKSTIDGLMVICKGSAAHACQPEKGKNAASMLVDLIGDAFKQEEMGTLCTFLDRSVNNESNGCSFGLKMSDCVSGALTLNLGLVDIDDNNASACIDIRYPVTVCGKSVYEQFERVAKLYDLSVEVLHHENPLYVESSSELVQILSSAYESVMGEKPQLYSTGGGTYARKLGGKGVAFGPAFPDDDVRMHNSDESIDKDKFFKHAQICLEAMYRMYISD